MARIFPELWKYVIYRICLSSYGWTTSALIFFFFPYHNPGSLKDSIQSFSKAASKPFFSPFNFSICVCLSLFFFFDKLTIHTPQQNDSNLYFTFSLTDLMNFDSSLMFMGDAILFILRSDDRWSVTSYSVRLPLIPDLSNQQSFLLEFHVVGNLSTGLKAIWSSMIYFFVLAISIGNVGRWTGCIKKRLKS